MRWRAEELYIITQGKAVKSENDYESNRSQRGKKKKKVTKVLFQHIHFKKSKFTDESHFLCQGFKDYSWRVDFNWNLSWKSAMPWLLQIIRSYCFTATVKQNLLKLLYIDAWWHKLSLAKDTIALPF